MLQHFCPVSWPFPHYFSWESVSIIFLKPISKPKLRGREKRNITEKQILIEI